MLTERDTDILDALRASNRPLNVKEVTAAIGQTYTADEEKNRAALNRMAASGAVEKVSRGGRPFYSAVVRGEAPERFAVEIPRLGHEGITDPDVLDEIEAEKVWTVAALLRGGNTAWGIDMGIDADVREARALMAEARRQVRERAPIGEHYMEGEPAASASEAEQPS